MAASTETDSLLPTRRGGDDETDGFAIKAAAAAASSRYRVDNAAADSLRRRVRRSSSSSPSSTIEDATATAIDRCRCCPSWCFRTVHGIHLHPLSITLTLMWSAGLLLFFIVVGNDVREKWPRLTGELSPGTAVSLHRAEQLDFPAITVCNLAKSVPLTPVRCSTYDSTGSCPEFHVPFIPKNTTKRRVSTSGSGSKGNAGAGGAGSGDSTGSDLEDDEWVYESDIDMRKNMTDQLRQKLTKKNLLRHCLVFNNDRSADPYRTHRKGLADALTVVLSINLAKYPSNTKYSGVHIDMHPQCDRSLGNCPDELESTIVAAPGSPRFYRMTKHRHLYLNGTSVEYYDAKDSASGDYQFAKHFGPEDDTVVLTFLYDDMSLTEVREVPRYTWFNMLAEIGGIIGLLFGVGIFSIISSLLKCFFLGKSHLNSFFV